VFYAALEKPELLKKCYSPRLMSFHEILGEHIRERIDNGVLRNVEPVLMGRALVGIIAYQQILSQLLGGDSRKTNSTNRARTYVDLWLRGTLKSEPPARRFPPQESANKVPETAA